MLLLVRYQFKQIRKNSVHVNKPSRNVTKTIVVNAVNNQTKDWQSSFQYFMNVTVIDWNEQGCERLIMKQTIIDGFAIQFRVARRQTTLNKNISLVFISFHSDWTFLSISLQFISCFPLKQIQAWHGNLFMLCALWTPWKHRHKTWLNNSWMQVNLCEKASWVGENLA